MPFLESIVMGVGSAVNAVVNFVNGKKGRDSSQSSQLALRTQQNKIQEAQTKVQEARIMMDHVHHQQGLEMQARQRDADRALQADIARENRSSRRLFSRRVDE
jgi:hypothetical protein